VHAYGRPRLLPEPAQAKAVLEKMVATYESGFAEPWRLDLPERYETGMIGGIMAFEIELTRLEGKAKLSQNRKPEDQKAALAGLSAQPDPDSQATAQMMRDFGVGV
jgi:transcriptional regulator